MTEKIVEMVKAVKEGVAQITSYLASTSLPPHILSPNAGGALARHTLQNEIQEQLESIATDRHQIEQMLQLLEPLPNKLASSESSLKKLLSPIEVLPPEIIAQIIQFSAQSQDPCQILSLSQVSSTWRLITLSYSQLFTRADWADWAPELLQLWGERARCRPLEIVIDEDAICRLCSALNDESDSDDGDLRLSCAVLDALRQAIPHAECLDVRSHDYSEYAVMLLEDLLDEARPALRRLKISLPAGARSVGTSIEIDCPGLRSLYVYGAQVCCEAPLQELVTLELHGLYSPAPEVEWSRLCGPILTLCPAVESISITFSGDFIITGPKHVLPKVKNLSPCSWKRVRTLRPYQSLLDMLDLPISEKLRIQVPQIEGLVDVLRKLPSSLAHLHIISVAKRDFVTLPRKVVECLTSGSTSVLLSPGLTCLGCFVSTPALKAKLSRHEVRALTGQPEFTNLKGGLMTLLEARKLTRVTFPVISQALVDLGRQHDVRVMGQYKG
ncbi:hypothetical protein DL93DRAFT_2231448 [Clavulina sp. PMI_390]|nr:hypothetical protein DL93DRAFT_2231448 [Clavulina sp. PMI_390]